MAISQVGSATSDNSGGTAVTSLAITAFPTGWAAGDVTYIILGWANSNVTAAGATGWTDISGEVAPGGSLQLQVFRRVMQGGDSVPNFTWSSSSTRAVAGVVTLRGVDTATPEDDVQSLTYTDNIASTDAPAVTTAVANDFLLSVYGNSSTRTGTPPGTQTELLDLLSGANTPGVQINKDTNLVAAVGSTGTRTETISAAINQRAAISIAARSAAGAPPAIRRVLTAVSRASTW